MSEKKYKILEIVGIPVIYLVATLLHFVYDLSGGSTLAILFGAVNESVWEHIKIFAVGFVLWAIIVLLWVRPPFYKYVVSKTLSLYFMMLAIIVFFYTYNMFTPEPILWLDLVSSFVFVALSQYLSYRLTTEDNNLSDYFAVAVMLLMMFFVMFFSFTVFPPKADLFKDPQSGAFGIVDTRVDNGAIMLDKLNKKI